MMELNKYQKKAVETIDENVAVTAGAGTGKTKVLTERFIYLLENGDLEEYKEIESIVAITFTNKATQEMLERIRAEIRKRSNKDEKWKRFYRDMEKANISTIHGFCARILRENPMEAKIDPYFEILDDVESFQLLKESIFQVLSEGLEEDENTFNMMVHMNQNRVENIVSDFYSLYRDIRNIGTSLEEVKESTLAHLESLEYEEESIGQIRDLIEYIMSKSRSNSKIVKIKDHELWIDFRDGNLKEDIYTYASFLKDNLGNNKKVQGEIDRVNELLDKILSTKEKEYLWLYETILDLLIEIHQVYRSKKMEIGALDYDDLQIKLLELFDDEEVLRKYQNKFKYFMIDEFQDTNELQKKIFYRLASLEEPLDRQNLFVVGDPKQSIYGFRGADIDVFYQVMEDMGNTIVLKDNYRSVNTVLEFVNEVFSQLMAGRYDELFFNKKSKNEIDILILENEEKLSNEEASYREAYDIAKRIKALVAEGRFKYRDIAILFRASTRNHIYEKALKDYNIPYYNSSSKRFYHRQEILDILNGLKTISNPYDKLAAIGFLRSPMVGLKDTTIYWLLKEGDQKLYSSLLKHRDNPRFSGEERSKLGEAAKLLSYFYRVKNLYGVDRLVSLLVEKTLFIETSLLKAEGKQIVANIYKFMEMANEFYRDNNGSLEDFIDYIESLKATSESESIIQSEEEDVVKLMTIHSSKGLQFPVVIIAEMGRINRPSTPRLLYNKELGIGVRLEDCTGLYERINNINKEREAEELKRILYVAMTRAEEMLILACYGQDTGFKKLIKGILPEGKYEHAEELELEKEDYIPVRDLDESLLLAPRIEEEGEGEKAGKANVLPLLYNFPNFNKKEFSYYNISQFQKFKSCRRSFYLDYFWGLDTEFDLDEEDIKVDDYLVHKWELDYRAESGYSVDLPPPMAAEALEDKVEALKESKEADIVEEGLRGLDKGNIVHKFCQLYREGLDREVLLGDIVRSFGFKYHKAIERQLKPYIDNYLKFHREDYDEVHSEKPFYFKIGDSYFKGIIDRIVLKDGQIEIMDFKTNRVGNLKALIKYYQPQLQLYAYVVERIFKRKVESASILFLEKGIKVDIDISEAALKRTLAEVEDFIKFVDQHKDIKDYERAKECNEYCIHKTFCQISAQCGIS